MRSPDSSMPGVAQSAGVALIRGLVCGAADCSSAPLRKHLSFMDANYNLVVPPRLCSACISGGAGALDGRTAGIPQAHVERSWLTILLYQVAVSTALW